MIIVGDTIASCEVGSLRSGMSLEECSTALQPIILKLKWFCKETIPFLSVMLRSLPFSLDRILPNERLSSKREFTWKPLLRSPHPPTRLFFPWESLGSDARGHQFREAHSMPWSGFSWVVLRLYLNSGHTHNAMVSGSAKAFNSMWERAFCQVIDLKCSHLWGLFFHSLKEMEVQLNQPIYSGSQT